MGLKKPKVEDVVEAEVAEIEEVETVVEEVEVEEAEAETTAVVEAAAPADAKPLAPAASQSMRSPETQGKFESDMADDGFGGLEVGFYSFTVVKLATEGRFEDADDNDLGKSLFVNLMESKRKWAYNNSEDENVAEFSYDRLTNAKGELLAPILKEWEDLGGKVTEKKYLDVTCNVVAGDLEGEVLILSVSPSGVQKFTGHMGKLTYANKNPREVVTEVYVGPKVTSVPKPFYPWAFRLAKAK